MAALSRAPRPWKPSRSPSDIRPACPHGYALCAIGAALRLPHAAVTARRGSDLERRRRVLIWPAGTGLRHARFAETGMSNGADGLRHAGEDLEPRVQASAAENGGHHGRGGSQAQEAAQQGGAPAGPDQHGQPARITEGHPGQIDDDPAGPRPRQADEPLTQDGYGRDVDFAADLTMV